MLHIKRFKAYSMLKIPFFDSTCILMHGSIKNSACIFEYYTVKGY